MVGSAVLRKAKSMKFKNIILKDKKSLDLRNQSKVLSFLKKSKPDAIIIAAAKVGGINANNKYKADFIYDNLTIQNNLIHSAYMCGIKNLIFLGSSCVYPKKCKQPIKESYLLSSFLEKTNEPYAIAKIAGIKLCESYNYQYNLNYKCLMPSNVYGINDNYDQDTSHFFPALIKKIILAITKKEKQIKIWGNGKPLRELTYCDDIADACFYFLGRKTSDTIINIGSGFEKSIEDFALLIMKYLGVNLNIIYEKKKLVGTPRKLLDSTLARKYGWKHTTPFINGLKNTVKDYLERYKINL